VTAPKLTSGETTNEPAGKFLYIANRGSETLRVFPADGDDLGAGANTAITLASGVTAQWTAVNAATWNRDY
jgi:hypothetical protein